MLHATTSCRTILDAFVAFNDKTEGHEWKIIMSLQNNLQVLFIFTIFIWLLFYKFILFNQD